MIEYTKSKPLRVVTLCSGYDSQCLALERLKRQFPDFDYTLVAWSEIDTYAIKAHDALFPEAKDRNLGDMSKIDWSKVPDFDLLTYSTPCTDLSSAGQQKGVAEGSGTRSSLLWFTRNAIIAKKPKYLLFENVKALITEKFLPYFLKWQEELRSYGYTNFAKVLNAVDYGVPQNRERIFMVSILGDARYYFPEPFPLTKRLKDVLEDKVDESYYLSDERVQGLIKSTLKQHDKGNGFKFEPKTPEQVATTVQASGCNRKTDNFMLVQTNFDGRKYHAKDEAATINTYSGSGNSQDQFVVCGALRGRKDTPEEDKHHLELETNSPDVSNTITSVQKDNVIVVNPSRGG